MSEHRRHHRYRRHATWGSTALSIIVLIIVMLARTGKLPPPVINAQPGLYPVTHVSDGDTISVRLPTGETRVVRLIGVDTPESVKPNTPVQCGAKAASDHTKAVMTGASVRLAPDPLDSDTDKYGRLLRYVYLPDGTLYNEQLVQQGYGFAYTIFDFAKKSDFIADQASAKAAGKGIWSECNVDATSDILQTTGIKS
jgi:micrococcal nuclease